MKFSDWKGIYQSIIDDMGYSQYDDEAAVRVLKAVTVNSNLVDDDEASTFFADVVTVVGNSPELISDLSEMPPEGPIVASGSSVGRLMAAGFSPNVIVTDLDGDIEPQIIASENGALTFIHAHGDNTELIREYAWKFKGPVVLTTQSVPENTVSNYGGFTDGDRAVCIARHFGAKRICMLGFDFNNPMPKSGSDSNIKQRKLKWAEKIIDYVAGDCAIYPASHQPS